MAEQFLMTLRVPLDREHDNKDGKRLNRGIGHIDVPVVIAPELPIRGERQNTDSGSRIALREWNEQVLLHEVLHVALLQIHHKIATPDDPHAHEIVSRIEVALWETGWRFTPSGQEADVAEHNAYITRETP